MKMRIFFTWLVLQRDDTRAGEMAQWVKVPAAVKPDNWNLSSFSGTHMEEES